MILKMYSFSYLSLIVIFQYYLTLTFGHLNKFSFSSGDKSNKSKITVMDFPFWNHSLPLDERLDDLLKRLTLKEMVNQMVNGGGYPEVPAPAIERLGIPPYNFDTECLRGVMDMNSTSFPMPIGLSATFSPEIIYDVASAISTEVRGIFNNASAKGDYGDMTGLNCFAPVINLVRHPLWGRSQETYGEDPFLTGIFAASYVKGLQGNHPKYVKAISGCKHFAVHSGPENIPSSRMTFDAKVSTRDLRLSYLPHFKACIDAGALNLMCSYNSINGIPACAHKTLLTDLVRGEYNFKGFIISDMDALENIVTGHKYAPDYLQAAALAANAGVDLELHGDTPLTYNLLEEAVEKDLVSFATIYNRTRTLFYARMKLGLFDPPNLNPYSTIKASYVVQSPYHRKLAIDVATKTFVMLKNIKKTLPFTEGTIEKLAIIGPMSDNLRQLFGGYAPIIDPKFSSTPYQGLKDAAKSTILVSGCESNKCEKYDATSVINATLSSDVIIVCLGTGQSIEGESKDRPSMDLSGHQNQLLQDVIKYAKQPIVLLLFTGCPVDLRMANMSDNVGAIIQCFYPAQSTGSALRKVLFINDNDGTVVSPSGRLPYTWPTSLDQIPPMENYSLEGRTYRYSKHTPLYPFGYGLSYTKFFYSGLSLSKYIIKSEYDVINVNLRVQNMGSIDSEEVVQVYISWEDLPKSIVMPQLQLVAVSRKVVPVSERPLDVTLTFHGSQLKIWDDSVGFRLQAGTINVFVGGQQPYQSLSSGSNVLMDSLHVSV